MPNPCRYAAYTLWLSLLFFAAHTSAQPEFEQRLSFDEIQIMLEEGTTPRDLRKQALAWYQWACHSEEQIGIPDVAFKYLTRSAELFKEAGDSSAYYRVRSDLADHLSSRKLWDEAIKAQQEALDYYRRTGNLHYETHLLAKLSRVYVNKGDFKKGKDLKLEFSAKNRILKDTILDITMAMEEVQRSEQAGRYDMARYEASVALRLAEQTGRTDLIAWGQYSVGYFNFLDREYKMALFFLKKAEKTTPRANLALRHNICRQLWNTYEALDSIDLALEYAKRTAAIADSLLSLEREASLHRLAIQYDTREKRREIEQLVVEKSAVQEKSKQQRAGLTALGVALGAVLLALFVIVRDYNHRIRVSKVIAAQTAEINQQKIRDLENTLKIENMQSMLAGQESERQRVAQDLHDSVGGLLAAAKIQIENMTAKNAKLAKDTDWAKIRALLDETVAETRHISRNMQPSALLEFGLVTAVRDLTSRVHGDGLPHITFQHFGEFEDLDRDVALNCYRIVQELVQNSLKHAQANEILVQITRSDNQLAILVEDDGAGFDFATVKKGMGTDNVARRAQFLKAELSVQTAKGQGSSTLVTIPIQETKGKP